MDLQDITFDEYTEQHRRGHLDAIRAWAESRELPGPVQLEIGSNRGRFLRGLAALYPDKSIVGIELRRSFVEALEPVLKRLGPTNAHILSADANLALPMLFADGTLERAYVLFPDPWWKKRHAKRRLLTPTFLDLLADKIAVGKHLIVKTDVEPYAEVIAEQIEATPRWRRVHPGDADWPSDDDDLPETTRERKVKGAEAPFWKIYAVNTGAPSDASLRGGLPRERFAKPDAIVDPKNGRRPRLRGSR